MKITTNHGEGSQLIIDAFECNQKLESIEAIEKFLLDIADDIDMTPISEPKVINHKAEKEEDSGITGFLIIAESHISIHTYPKKKFASIDIFSCKEFDYNRAVEYTKTAFAPKRVQHNILHRGHSEDFDGSKFCKEVKGFELDDSMTISDFLEKSKTIGFQASHLGESLDILRKMKENNSTIFLSFTSNMVSSGLREIFAQIVKEKLVDIIITGVGSIEEDIMKSRKPFLIGDFDANDIELHRKGINRIGNVFVEDEHYEKLEDFCVPIFSELFEKQKNTGKLCSPSALIRAMGEKVEDQNSILYWATKNDIPIFCPAITDGAIGLQLYFFKQKHNDFGVDTTDDMKELASFALHAKSTAGIILGGGFAKHHLIGINILREGLDYAIYVTTAKEGDGSLSGARPREAKSWSKLRETGTTTCIEGDATIIFPLLAVGMKKILKERKVEDIN